MGRASRPALTIALRWARARARTIFRRPLRGRLSHRRAWVGAIRSADLPGSFPTVCERVLRGATPLSLSDCFSSAKLPDPHFGDGPLDASKARLTDVLEDVGTRSLKYLYDFGDGWEHSIRIERITDALQVWPIRA